MQNKKIGVIVLKEYKLSFDICGLILFLIIMIPNFIWFAVPAPNDVLRAASVTGTADMIASVCQVLMVIALCILVNRKSGENKESGTIHRRLWIVAVIICCLLYFACWAGYYTVL